MFNVKKALLTLIIAAPCFAGDTPAERARAAGRTPVERVAGARRNFKPKRRQEPIPAEYQKLAKADDKPDTFVAKNHHGTGRGAQPKGLKQPKPGY